MITPQRLAADIGWMRHYYWYWYFILFIDIAIIATTWAAAADVIFIWCFTPFIDDIGFSCLRFIFFYDAP